VVLGLLLISVVTCQEPSRIKVILTGRVSEGFLIRDFFLSEPLTDPLVIPSRDLPGGYKEGRKTVRVYFPRTYEDLASYDFIIFAGTDVLYFTQTQQRWIHDAIRDHGMGGLNSRSVLSGIYYPQWVSSVAQKAFPNDVDAVIKGLWWKFHTSMQIVLNEDPALPPVMTMFEGKPIKWTLSNYDAMVVRPRPGSTIWSWIRGPFPELAIPKPGYTPHLISWKYGKGTTWTCHDRLCNWWQDIDANPYGLDMIMNMVLYSTGRPLPKDIEVIHTIRRMFSEYQTRKRLILGTMELGEKFGASMSRAEERMVKLNDQYRDAMRSYLLQREEETLDKVTKLVASSKEADNIATRELRAALMWVYFINWLVVTGTLMISGFVVWTLMVRRRLYKEVVTTELRGYRLEA